MNTYVVDISNSTNVEKENNKTVENLLEEYVELLRKLEKIEPSEIVSLPALLSAIPIYFIVTYFKLSEYVFVFSVVLSILFFSYFSLKEAENIEFEIEEIKIKLLTALKQEKFIVEHNKETSCCSRHSINTYAKRNGSFCVGNKNFNAQKLLIEQPNIQRIVERKTTYTFLKLHNVHQDLINQLCKEQEDTEIIYEN